MGSFYRLAHAHNIIILLSIQIIVYALWYVMHKFVISGSVSHHHLTLMTAFKF